MNIFFYLTFLFYGYYLTLTISIYFLYFKKGCSVCYSSQKKKNGNEIINNKKWKS